MTDDADTTEIKEELSSLYRAMGRAAIEWQSVEDGLREVFRAISGCPDKGVAQAIFYSPQDFSVKLQMTDNPAKLLLEGYGLLSEWKALRSQVKNASEVRNALAHFDLVYLMTPGDFGVTKETKPALRPNVWDVNAASKQGGPKLKLKDMDASAIAGHIKVFHQLALDLMAFAGRIPPHETSAR